MMAVHTLHNCFKWQDTAQFWWAQIISMWLFPVLMYSQVLQESLWQPTRNMSLGLALRNIESIFADEYDLRREWEPGAEYLFLHWSRPLQKPSFLHSFIWWFMHQILTVHLPSTLCCKDGSDPQGAHSLFCDKFCDLMLGSKKEWDRSQGSGA